MKKILLTFVCLMFLVPTFAQENLKTIKGKITHLDGPVVNAEIKVSGFDDLYKSDTNGRYEVTARQGDVITFSYPSLRDMEIVVEDVTRILNIEMSADINELDEVVVEASKRRSQRELEEDYTVNKSIIRTAFGYIDADRAAGRISLLSEEDVHPISLCVLDLLRNKFAGVDIIGDCNRGGEVILGRSYRQGPAIWDIDGQIFAYSGPFTPSAPIWLDVNSIKRIAILRGLATTIAYGSLGDGGVVVINTVSGNVGTNSGKFLDRARLRHNIYQNDALSYSDMTKNEATYLNEYGENDDFEYAKSVYEKNREQYYNSPYFFIDSYAHFMRIGNEKFAKEILQKNVTLFDTNAVHLKAMAYFAEEGGDLKAANDLYEQVFILRPSYSQSYRDLAESYRDINNHKKSASMYARHNYLMNEGFLDIDSTGIFPIMERESENLVALEGDKIMKGIQEQKRQAKFLDFKGTRLFFEWNDSEAEFELQFVNPEKHFYTWRHTSTANAARIMDEKLKGYSSEEFLIDGSLAGNWQVNMNYKGNKKLEPSYLKVTVYHNYGLNSQRKEVKVYRLSLKNSNYRLFTLNNPGSISTN